MPKRVAGSSSWRRADKWLFANFRKRRGLSYRERWVKAGRPEPFHSWLKKLGLTE